MSEIIVIVGALARDRALQERGFFGANPQKLRVRRATWVSRVYGFNINVH